MASMPESLSDTYLINEESYEDPIMDLIDNVAYGFEALLRNTAQLGVTEILSWVL